MTATTPQGVHMQHPTPQLKAPGAVQALFLQSHVQSNLVVVDGVGVFVGVCFCCKHIMLCTKASVCYS